MAQRVGRGIALLFHGRGTPRPHFTPGKDPVPILHEAGWAPGPVRKGGKSRPHRDSIPDRPAWTQSLYRLSYRAHNKSSKGVVYWTEIGWDWNRDSIKKITHVHVTLYRDRVVLRSSSTIDYSLLTWHSRVAIAKRKVKILRKIWLLTCWIHRATGVCPSILFQNIFPYVSVLESEWLYRFHERW